MYYCCLNLVKTIIMVNHVGQVWQILRRLQKPYLICWSTSFRAQKSCFYSASFFFSFFLFVDKWLATLTVQLIFPTFFSEGCIRGEEWNFYHNIVIFEQLISLKCFLSLYEGMENKRWITSSIFQCLTVYIVCLY